MRTFSLQQHGLARGQGQVPKGVSLSFGSPFKQHIAWLARPHGRKLSNHVQATTADAVPMGGTTMLATSLVPLPHGRSSVSMLSELASAWNKVSRRLPQSEGGEDSQKEHLMVIGALRLALGWLAGAPTRADGRSPSGRCVQLAALLADLCAAGLPLDAPAISAGVLLEAADTGFLDHDTIAAKLGPEVAKLVHDVLRVRTAPQRVELYDDVASSAIREWCIAFNDIRANVVEVVSRWDELRYANALPPWDRQALALEALQVYAPLGHALGLGTISAAMEDASFQILFPGSYAHTAEWLHSVVDPMEGALFTAQQQLLSALDAHPRFNQLAAGCVLRARTKSLFSMMRKMLRLGDLRQGGRRREEVFDLLGMRAVVQPRPDLPAEEAEAAAQEACYVVQEVAAGLWQAVPERTKDYIARPKRNGYRSIHLTVRMDSVMESQRTDGSCSSSSSGAASSQPFPHIPASSALGVDLPHAPHTSRRSPLDSVTMDSLDALDSSSSRSSISGSIASVDGEEGMLAPFMELQIRTQAMDDRAESGEAAHAAYKGGLDVRQARQLQAWTRELQHRLAVRPQGKLLLPPSVVARAEGAVSVLESVDLDADGPEAGPLGPATAEGRSGDDDGPAGVGGSSGTEAAGRRGSTARARATESLFRFMDRNGDGVLSVDEIKAQLQEMEMSARPMWSSPYGAITFDPAADMSALSMGSMDAFGGGTAPRAPGFGPAPRQAAGGELDLDVDTLYQMVAPADGELSLEDFKAFINQASLLRAQRRKQQERQAPQGQQQAPPGGPAPAY